MEPGFLVRRCSNDPLDIWNEFADDREMEI